MVSPPPTIFSPARRNAVRSRRHRLRHEAKTARFLAEDMVEDVLERLAFLRLRPARALTIGDWTGALGEALRVEGAEVVRAGDGVSGESIAIDEEVPFPVSGFDFVASLGTLDTVNDLPGALIHLRNALAPGGLVIASFLGAGSLPVLRNVMLAADGDRPAARIHPLVDVRAGAQLLQRAGWKDPVVDSRPIRVSYRSLGRLVQDLREQGLSNALASPAPPLGRAAVKRAEAAFEAEAGPDGRVVETFEILTLSGRRSLAGT